MKLIHFKKTKGSKSTIQIGPDAITNAAFAVYGDEKQGEFSNTTFGWKLPVTDTEGQYVGHRFELQMEIADLDKLIEAAQWAREQAGQTTPPEETEIKPEVSE